MFGVRFQAFHIVFVKGFVAKRRHVRFVNLQVPPGALSLSVYHMGAWDIIRDHEYAEQMADIFLLCMVHFTKCSLCISV